MSENKQYISKVKLADGTTADIKDQEARAEIKSLLEDTIILDCGEGPEEEQ